MVSYLRHIRDQIGYTCVQPGGVLQSYSENLFLELAPVRQNNSISVSFSFPPHVVEGSPRGYVALVGTYNCSSFPSLVFWMLSLFIQQVALAEKMFFLPLCVWKVSFGVCGHQSRPCKHKGSVCLTVDTRTSNRNAYGGMLSDCLARIG